MPPIPIPGMPGGLGNPTIPGLNNPLLFGTMAPPLPSGPHMQVGPILGPPLPPSTIAPSAAAAAMPGNPLSSLALGGIPGSPTGAVTPAAAGAAPGAVSGLSRLIPKSGFGKTGLMLGAGIAGNVLGNAAGGQESGLGRFLSGAGTGAGIGAVVGNAIPIPGVGAGIGALAGGAIGGGIGLLTGGDKGPDFESRLDELLKGTGIPDDQVSELKATYELLVEAGGGGDEAKQQALTTIVNSVMQNQAANEQAQQAQYEMLSRQAMTAEFFRPLTQQLIQSAQQRAAIGERVANQLPENYRGIALQQNAASLDNATRTANAYAAQAQLLPALATMEYQKGLQDQIAQQQAASVMQQIGVGGAAGGGSLSELTAQLAAASQGGG